MLNAAVTALSSQSDHGLIWRLAAGQCLHYREWGGDYVLYNDISGDTHLLDQTAMDVLLTLREAPTSEAVLLELLGETSAPQGDDDAAALLDQLQALALIEVAP